MAIVIDVVHANVLELPTDFSRDVDVLIADLPYSPSVHGRAVSTRTGGVGVRQRDFGFAPLSSELLVATCQIAARVKRWTAIFTDIESVNLWRMNLLDAGAEYVRAVPWVRWTQPQISGDRPPSGCEMVVLAHAKGTRKRWNGPGSLTHFDAKALRGAGKHPTEKPLDLMLDLVSWLSDPGETVLDHVCGSGTTIQAARLLGRNALGVERLAPWARKAQARVEATSLDDRDAERVQRWITKTCEEASRTPAPKERNKGTDVRTWERAQRRLDDVRRLDGLFDRSEP